MQWVKLLLEIPAVQMTDWFKSWLLCSPSRILLLQLRIQWEMEQVHELLPLWEAWLEHWPGPDLVVTVISEVNPEMEALPLSPSVSIPFEQ